MKDKTYEELFVIMKSNTLDIFDIFIKDQKKLILEQNLKLTQLENYKKYIEDLE